MRRVRSLALLSAWIFSSGWILTGPQAAWALPGNRPLGGDQPRVERPFRDLRSSKVFGPYRLLEAELCPLEQALFADAADGHWDDYSLLGAALVASGVADLESLRRYEMQMVALATELEQSGKVAGPPRERARAVFEFMHQRVLHGGYQLDCTDLAIALDEGRFNCVSASVLFNCLAPRFGLNACGVEMPGHAMSRLTLPDGPLDVETTCPGWFRLMDDPKKQAALVAQVLGARPPQGSSPAKPRKLSGVELVAMIYYNRGVDLLEQKRFAEAVAANAKALRLDPLNTTAQGNLLATLNNWAIDLDAKGRRVEAVDLLRRGLALQPTYETFQANYVHILGREIDNLCRCGRYRDALDVIGRAAGDRIVEPYFRRARLDTYRRWARTCLEVGQAHQAFAIFEEAKGRHGSLAAVLEAEAAEVSHRASELLRLGRPAEAIALLDQALLRQPGSKVLSDARRSAVTQRAAPVSANGDYAEATGRGMDHLTTRSS